MKPARSLSQTATLGVAWLMAQSLSVRALTLVSQLVLTWLLLPADFGAVSLANTVASMAAIVTNLGIDEVLLQRHRGIGKLAASAFWLNLGLATLAMAALMLGASTIAEAYHTPKLFGLIIVLSVSMPIGALSTVPQVKARADLKFGLLAIYNTSELGAIQILTVLLAWAGMGAYSFVLPIPILAVVKACVFWTLAPISFAGRPRLIRFSYLAINGLTVFGSRVITEAVGQGSLVILGVMTGDTVVGLYSFAFRLAAQPVRVLAGNFHSVMFPTLAQIRTEPARQGASALHAAEILSFVVMPLCFMQAALSEPALRLVASPRWGGAILMVQILSLGLPFDAISWMAGALINARGEFKRALVYSCLFSPAFFVGVYIGARIDAAVGVAVAVTLFYAVISPIFSIVVFRQFTNPVRLVIDSYLVPAAYAAITMGFAYWCSLAPALHDLQIVRCVVIVVVGGGLYLVAFRILKPQLYHDLIERTGLGRIVRSPGLRRLRAYLSPTS